MDIHQICEQGRINELREFLETNANQGFFGPIRSFFGLNQVNINIQDEYGNTPLQYACDGNHVDCVRLLLENHANITLPDCNGNIPLHNARRSVECAQLLINAGSPIDIKNRLGNTPLHLACNAGNAYVVKLLIHHGADINSVSIEGNTPLATACFRDYHECVQLLINHGADMSIKNNEGMSLLHHAMNAPNTMKLLLDAGCNVNEKDLNGDTPLHLSCANGNFDCVKLLIEYGADPFVLNNENRYPVDETILIRDSGLLFPENIASILDEIIQYLQTIIEFEVKEPDTV